MSARAVLLETSSETSGNASVGDLDGDGDRDVVIGNDAPSPKLVYLATEGEGRCR